jgi:CheY-like chemotaxis protein
MPTILVVDDEPTIRFLVRAALDGTGYRLIEASDGLSALEVALTERPDVILLDIALPRLSGLEVCRRLKENPATAGAPVLLITGLVQEAERQAAEEVGAQAFIAKPFSPAALVSQVEDALLRRPAAVSR